MCDAKVLADVRADLGGFSGDTAVVGKALFLRLFKRAGVQDMFDGYKGKAVGEIDAPVTAHGKKVVDQLVEFVQKANTGDMAPLVAKFVALHKEKKIPHSALADAKGDIVATLSEFGLKNGSWGAFLDFFLSAVKY